LKILKVYEGTCFRHVMSRVCYKWQQNLGRAKTCECERCPCWFIENHSLDQKV
jgi:hypothetical protein